MALCFLHNGTVHSMVAHLVMLKLAESKQTRGKIHFKSSSKVLLTVLCRGLCSLLATALLSHDSSSISVQFHSLANWWTSKYLDFSLMRKQVKPMCLPFLFHRDIRDTSDRHRCRWPHLWQQRSSGLQYPPWPAILFRRPQNRWENNQIYPRLSHTHCMYKSDWPTLETKVCSNVETFGCSVWVH